MRKKGKTYIKYIVLQNVSLDSFLLCAHSTSTSCISTLVNSVSFRHTSGGASPPRRNSTAPPEKFDYDNTELQTKISIYQHFINTIVSVMYIYNMHVYSFLLQYLLKHLQTLYVSNRL